MSDSKKDLENVIFYLITRICNKVGCEKCPYGLKYCPVTEMENRLQKLKEKKK